MAGYKRKKITPEIKQQMVTKYATGKFTYRTLAYYFGVSPSKIERVLREMREVENQVKELGEKDGDSA